MLCSFTVVFELSLSLRMLMKLLFTSSQRSISWYSLHYYTKIAVYWSCCYNVNSRREWYSRWYIRLVYKAFHCIGRRKIVLLDLIVLLTQQLKRRFYQLRLFTDIQHSRNWKRASRHIHIGCASLTLRYVLHFDEWPFFQVQWIIPLYLSYFRKVFEV